MLIFMLIKSEKDRKKDVERLKVGVAPVSGKHIKRIDVKSVKKRQEHSEKRLGFIKNNPGKNIKRNIRANDKNP